MNSKGIGEKTEAKIISCLVLKEKVVLIPFGDNQRYDIVIEDDDGTFKRIQCKTGRLKNGAIKFPTCSSSYHRTVKKSRIVGRLNILAFIILKMVSVIWYRLMRLGLGAQLSGWNFRQMDKKKISSGPKITNSAKMAV